MKVVDLTSDGAEDDSYSDGDDTDESDEDVEAKSDAHDKDGAGGGDQVTYTAIMVVGITKHAPREIRSCRHF